MVEEYNDDDDDGAVRDTKTGHQVLGYSTREE